MGRGGASGLWSSGVGSYQLSAVSGQQARVHWTRFADRLWQLAEEEGKGIGIELRLGAPLLTADSG